MRGEICKVSGCNTKIKQQGYCSKHYSQMYRHGRLTPETERFKYKEGTKCKHEGCEELASKREYCLVHYHQYRTYGKTFNKETTKNTITLKQDHAVLEIISLNKEHKANVLIDKEDVGKVKKFKWLYYGRYVDRSDSKTSLHRYLLNAPDDKVVDHINHNKLDNRKENIRICTVSQNTQNHRGYKSNTSGRTGVYLERGRWRARITVDNKKICLGTYEDKEKAIQQREKAEIKYFKEFRGTI